MLARDKAVGAPGIVRESKTVSLKKALTLAACAQEAGDLDDASLLYDRILEQLPRQPQALTMRASVAYRQGDEALGDRCIDRAIDTLTLALDYIQPSAPEQASLANLLLARNRLDEAARRLTNVELPLRPMRASATDFKARRDRARSMKRPSILMTSMPKSASESLWNMMATGLDLAQSHASIGLFPNCCLVPSRLREMAFGGVVAKEHIGPDRINLVFLANAGIRRILVHLRDPRQALLSWAHFVKNDVGRRMLAPIWRRVVPPGPILDRDLEHVIDWCIDHYLPLLVDFAESWSKLAEDETADIHVRCMTFERFVTDRSGYLTELLNFFDLNSFNEAAIKQAATIHWRRGRIDEWRQVLATDQRRRASEALPISLGERFGWAP